MTTNGPRRWPGRPLSVRALTRLLQALSILPIIGLVGFMVADQQIMTRAQQRADQAAHLEVEAQQFMISMQNEKSALNLFLYTGQRSFLTLYRTEAEKVTAVAAALQRDALALGLASDFARASREAATWRAWADSFRAAAESSGKITDTSVLVDGGQLFEGFRIADEQLSADAQAEAARAVDRAQTVREGGLIVIILGGAVAALVPLGLTRLIASKMAAPLETPRAA